VLVSAKCYKTLNTHNQSLKAEWELERVFTFAICRSFFASWRCVIFSLRVCCLVWCVLLSIAFLSFLFINNRLANLFIKESITVSKHRQKAPVIRRTHHFLLLFCRCCSSLLKLRFNSFGLSSTCIQQYTKYSSTYSPLARS